MKKYYLILLMCCLGMVNFHAFAEQGEDSSAGITCCTKGMQDKNENGCGDSDCKDGDATNRDKPECCQKAGGDRQVGDGRHAFVICCGGSKVVAADQPGIAADSICCSTAGDQQGVSATLLSDGTCCGKMSVAKKEDAALPMCKK